MAEVKDVKIEESWKELLSEEFEKSYFAGIKTYLLEQKQAGKTIYPPGPLIFNAFKMVPVDQLKIVILGQDPYHGPGEAHGLSFSVPMGVRVPPSLRNIYKELESTVEGFQRPKHGNLEAWANQGVLLLNAFLTVEHKKPKSHQKVGWAKFTDAVIKTISEKCEGVIFMLWGGFAKKKAALIDESKHLVLRAAHPSPLAGNAFLGNNHFMSANEYLAEKGKEVINWHLAE